MTGKVSALLQSRWTLLLLLGGLIALILFVMPQRRDRVVARDGSSSWESSSAPPRREIVWSPATVIKEIQRNFPAGDFLTPHLTDNGSALYFAFRKHGRSADLFISRFQNGRWQRPTKVDALCSSANDLGATFSRDGQQVFFVSDRAGGLGGYDLYTATRVKDGWSQPRNLGKKINTKANEHDPALSPDGLALYFASNRSDEQLDLYRATRKNARTSWSDPEPLTEINQLASHERAPFVAGSGKYLYFASNRKQGKGIEPNFDLYRARIGERITDIENLGSSINSPADETESSLSPEGFRLLFASNRDGNGLIYQSSAQEVVVETQWDESRWLLFQQWWWKVLLIAITSVTLLYLIFAKHSWLIEQAVLARFLAISLVVHILIVLLMAFTPLPQVLFSSDDNKNDKVAAAPQQLTREKSAQGASRPAFERFADPGRVQGATQTQIPKQAPTSTKRVVRTNLPKMSVPGLSARTRPIEERQPQVSSPPPLGSAGLPPLVRRSRTIQSRPLSAEPDEQKLEETPAGQMRRVVGATLKIPRQEAKPAPVQAPKRALTQLPQLARSRVRLENEAKQAPPLKSTSTTPSPLQRLARSRLGRLPSLAPPDAVTPSPVPSAKLPMDPGRKDVVIKREERVGPTLKTKTATLKGDNLLTKRPATPVKGMPLSSKMKPPELTQSPLPLKPSRVVRKIPLPEDLPKEIKLASSRQNQKLKLERIKLTMSKQAPGPIQLSSDFPNPLTKARQGPRPLRGPKLEQSLSLDKPSLSSLESDLIRRRRATQPAHLDEQIDLKQLLGLRNKKIREKLVETFGGTKKSEEAVERGLKWLASIQNKDGSWSLNKHQGTVRSETAGTGFALLPFLGAGHHHRAGKYQAVISKGIDWLIKHQKKTGELSQHHGNHRMYSHGLASIALCEAFGLSKDARLRGPAQKALDFIVQAQHRSTGGWRYNPGETGDTSVFGWQIMALKSGQIAGLKVPNDTFVKAQKWLKRVEVTREPGTFGYVGRSASPPMTAQGLLCLQFMGEKRSSPRLKSGQAYLMRYPVTKPGGTSYYWYNATQVLYHLQGEAWKKWNDSLRDVLVKSQIPNGQHAGSWHPRDQFERSGGRIMATSLRLLMLEVYYRHLPLYQALATN